MFVAPTSYFGSIAYFIELAQHSEIQIEAFEHFPKQTYRNRCEVNTANGIIALTIPVKKEHGSKTPIHQIQILEKDDWRMKHWRAIRSAYESSPYFDYYGSEVKELIFQNESNLLKFNNYIIEKILNWLDIDINLTFTDEFKLVENEFIRTICNKNTHPEFLKAPYYQVFPSDKSFHNSLSILDVVFCEGPLTRNLIIQG